MVHDLTSDLIIIRDKGHCGALVLKRVRNSERDRKLLPIMIQFTSLNNFSSWLRLMEVLISQHVWDFIHWHSFRQILEQFEITNSIDTSLIWDKLIIGIIYSELVDEEELVCDDVFINLPDITALEFLFELAFWLGFVPFRDLRDGSHAKQFLSCFKVIFQSELDLIRFDKLCSFWSLVSCLILDNFLLVGFWNVVWIAKLSISKLFSGLSLELRHTSLLIAYIFLWSTWSHL